MGFQLWANLPVSHKMIEPRYRDVLNEQIPEVQIRDGVKVKIVAGKLNEIKGLIQDIITEPEYIDVLMNRHFEFTHNVKNGYTIFAYIYKGEGYFDENKDSIKKADQIVLFENGDIVKIFTVDKQLRFLLISGKLIGESIAWYSPIVMNTKEE